ncbi:MAG TPA: DUF1700 domain-containing protein [Candidatus Mediterraneibacter tabaqchaliae]|uniref:DUF1700 domain-containing protein n=1 Tax=Candidatus Mediterraneibacter tabaqchaliae TaxID=2838689 RepID=A0A9D2R3Z1_9FIRM|nr:DUF1700 domain-containing protein [Candidatus Mediterraneibacter tabaqchaliae]
MNRIEFLSELEQRLSGIPEDERQSAIQYYADYLADAGEENEAEAIRELGSPEKVAESIKADYYGTEFDESRFDHKDYMEKYGQRSSQGTGSGNTSGGRPGADGYGYGQENGYGTGQENGQENGQGNGPAQKNAPWTSRGLKIFLVILIAIVIWPVTLGVAGIVLGVAAAIFFFFAGLVIAAIAVMISGGVVAVTGLVLLVIPPAGMIVTGIGILLFVLGLIATVGTVKLCMIVYPAMIRGFVNLFRRPIYGKAV